MELATIEQTLERYFEGETTLKEEQLLRAYFTGTDVAAHLEGYIGLFSAFAKAQTETYDAPVALPASSHSYKWLGAVASIAIAIGVALNFNNNTTLAQNYGTYNEEVAILKTKQALGLMTQMIKQGTAQLEVVKEFPEATDKFIKK